MLSPAAPSRIAADNSARALATVERISERLGRMGNIASDRRPILGLDSRNLLEITLVASPGAYLVPAHIWTPWFAALGSQSGFESIAACYGDSWTTSRASS